MGSWQSCLHTGEVDHKPWGSKQERWQTAAGDSVMPAVEVQREAGSQCIESGLKQIQYPHFHGKGQGSQVSIFGSMSGPGNQNWIRNEDEGTFPVPLTQHSWKILPVALLHRLDELQYKSLWVTPNVVHGNIVTDWVMACHCNPVPKQAAWLKSLWSLCPEGCLHVPANQTWGI